MDKFEAPWSNRKKSDKRKRKPRVYPSSLAGGIDEIPEMLGKRKPLAAEDRPEEERMTRAQAEALATNILMWLEPTTEFAEVAGSYRRGREDPGDLDVVVILKPRVRLPEIAELWLAEGKASAINWVGEKKTQMVIDGVKVDIRTTTPRALGAALLYFTGPAGYNIGIRSAAKRAGFKLSEYGLFNRETGEYIAGATEEDIYTALGRNYRPPTERRAETFEAQYRASNEMEKAILDFEKWWNRYYIPSNPSKKHYVRKPFEEGDRYYGWLWCYYLDEDDERLDLECESIPYGNIDALNAWIRQTILREKPSNFKVWHPIFDEEYEAETFEATAVYRGKIPEGAVGRAMLNQKLMDEAEMLEAIQKLENAVRLGLISEEEIMKGLQQKFGAEVVNSRYSDKGWSLFGRKLFKYGKLQGSIRGNISATTEKPMKRNNPDETYTGRHHVIWTQGADNQVFNQVSQKIKPESFQEWMDVIHETNRQESGVHHAEEFANEGSENPMRSAIIRGLRTAARNGYVVAAPPYGNRSASFYNNLAGIILEELGEIGTEELGPEVSGTGRTIDPYRVVADLASGRSVEIESPDEVSDYSVGIADMINSFTQQSTMMDRRDGFIPPEGYTRMYFDLPYNGWITRRLAWRIASAMGIYSRASDRLVLFSTPQKNRNCSMIVNMLLEELQPEVSGMTDEEKAGYYQSFGFEIMRQTDFNNGPMESEKRANRNWAESNYGTPTATPNVEVSARIEEKARADAARLNPFNAETQDFADRFEIQIRTSRGNTTERIPVGRVLIRRLREILGRQRQPYAVDVFGTEAAFNVMGPYGMQVYRPRPKLLATYKYGRFESGEMADYLNEKLGLN